MKLEDIILSEEAYILPRYQTILKKQGIVSAKDLIYNFPSKYENYTVSSLKDAVLENPMVIEGTICSKINVNFLKTKLSTVVFTIDSDGMKIKCTIFNRVYLKTKLNFGTVVRLQGRFHQNYNSFTVANIIILDELSRNIVPTYKIKDIAIDKYLTIIEKVLRRYKHLIIDELPPSLIESEKILSISDAITKLHLADSMEEINQALYRIKFEELLQYQISMKYLHYMRTMKTDCPIIELNMDRLKQLNSTLPYELTIDQKNAVISILKDLKSPFAMNRLLQGEVGSGKTIVSAFAALACISGGFQVVLMCPTEILSNQHYESFTSVFKFVPNIHIALLTGSTTGCERTKILNGLADGSINLVIGTHALFQEDVIYKNLGLVITDEEHRFGVHQRVLIKNKGLSVNYLKMSATPIPRSLATSYYGDTDISIIKTMPLNRKPVITKIIYQETKKEVIKHMFDELNKGHQIYVVTPLIEESENIDTANACEVYENLKRIFESNAKVGLIHGKLKYDEKEQIMEDFLANKIQILVATSVIEVGVNVKNATTILIIGAERFGVATLHQLRGRVMRSSEQPYCFLIPETENDQAIERLKMVAETSDGFALAEYDLLNRGPGEFFGEKQTGLANFHYANLLLDKDILHHALELSENIVDNHILMDNPEYKYLYEKAKQNYERKIHDLD